MFSTPSKAYYIILAIAIIYKCFRFVQVQNFVDWQRIYLLPHMPIFGFSDSAASKDMMSKISLQLSDREENIVGKEEIARGEQFLLFPQCFQKLSVVEGS